MDSKIMEGDVFKDNDSRMNGRKVQVADVFQQLKPNGRLKAGIWYAKCYTASNSRYNNHTGKPLLITLGNLMTRFTLVSRKPAAALPAHAEVA